LEWDDEHNDQWRGPSALHGLETMVGFIKFCLCRGKEGEGYVEKSILHLAQNLWYIILTPLLCPPFLCLLLDIEYKILQAGK
jgi:hypothetical protein